MAESIITRRKSVTFVGSETPSNYSTWVVQDENGAKYEVFNGYDYIENPNPSSTNLPFNKWLRNNSASNSIVFTNTVMDSFIYGGPNPTFNENSLPEVGFINNVVIQSAGNWYDQKVNDGFLFISTANRIRKLNISNNYSIDYAYTYPGNAVNLVIHDNFVYLAGTNLVRKLHKSNLGLVSTLSFGTGTNAIVINDNYLYVGGGIAVNKVRKFHLNNFTAVGNSGNYGGTVQSLIVNNGFIYAAGNSTGTIKQYNESTLSLVNTSGNYNPIRKIALSNNFIYAAWLDTVNQFNGSVLKFEENSLNFVTNALYGNVLQDLQINNGYVYAGGRQSTVRKYRETDLQIVNTTLYSYWVGSIAIANDLIYVIYSSINNIRILREKAIINDNQTYYAINKVKVGG
jgi:hypothetical protein